MAGNSLTDVAGIYQIRNTLNGHVYIGSAINILNRWRGHRRELRQGTHDNDYLQKAWDKYGEAVFVFEMLEVVMEKSQLLVREQRRLDVLFLLGPKGYNIALVAGAPMTNRKHTEETRAKLSLAKIGNQHLKGKTIWKGRKHTAATRAKLSMLHIGQKATVETRIAMAMAQTGRKQSVETRAKIAAANRRRPSASIKTRAKIAAAHIGRKLSAETRAKMSAAHLLRR